MKKIVTLSLLVFAGLIFLTGSSLNNGAKPKLLVYYFYGTHRCPTCMKIEATTKKVIDQNFSRELKEGVLVFKTFNVDLPENKKISTKYEASGPTLALTTTKNGKEKIENLTDFAFTKIHNETAFTTELKAKITKALK